MNLQILDRINYSPAVIGSEKIYYKKYPYKIKLLGSGIIYNQTSWFNILRWFYNGEQDNPHINSLSTKIVNSVNRCIYFKTKERLDDFYSRFKTDIEEIYGPISDEHIDALRLVNSKSGYDYEQYVIKENNFFNSYDGKIILNYPSINYFQSPSFLSTYHSNFQAYYQDLWETVDSIAPNKTRYYYRNIYINHDEIEDVEFYLKLKKGDVVQSKVKVLLVKNLFNR